MPNKDSEASKASKKAYRERNKEKIKATRKIYLEKNKERIIAQAKEYRLRTKDKPKKPRIITDEEKIKRKRYKEENREKIKAQNKEYQESNKEIIAKKAKEKRLANPEDHKAKAKKSYEKNKDKKRVSGKAYYEKNKEEILQKSRNRYEENKDQRLEQIYEYKQNRKATDPIFKMKECLRVAVWRALNRIGSEKNNGTLELVGLATWDELWNHLESQFKPGMTQENYGPIWHVDHRIPLASAKTECEINKLFHYTNLQPLFASDNISKGAKLNWIPK